MPRPRIVSSSGSASSPKSASRRSSSSLAASPCVLLAELVEVGRVVRRLTRRRCSSTARPTLARWRREASRSGPRAGRAARRRRSGSARPRARAGAPARPAPARSEPRAAAEPASARIRSRAPSITSSSRSPADCVAQVDVERRDQAGRKAVLGGAGGDARRERRDGLVADVLVDQVRCPPERVGGDARLEAEAVERISPAPRPRRGGGRGRPGTRRRRSGRRPRGRPRSRRRAQPPPAPWQ